MRPNETDEADVLRPKYRRPRRRPWRNEVHGLDSIVNDRPLHWPVPWWFAVEWAKTGADDMLRQIREGRP